MAKVLSRGTLEIMNQPTTRSMHIAIADDDEDDRMLIEEAWEAVATGDTLSFYADGADLLEALQTASADDRPDLILLDLNMPRMNGHEILIALKGHEELSDIPVIVVTTSTAPQDISLCYANGAAAFLTKSASFKDLTAALARARDFWAPNVTVESNPGTVYFCDDNEATRKIYEFYFERRGVSWTTRGFDDADELLKAFEQHPCDVVVSDIKMPRMDGITLTRELAIRNPKVAVMLITSSTQEVDPGLHPNLKGFLRKPVDPKLLIEQIDALLNKRQ